LPMSADVAPAVPAQPALADSMLVVAMLGVGDEFEPFLGDDDEAEGEEIHPKALGEGVALSVGYGPDGHSAQASWAGAVWKSDREIMYKTVLMGKPEVRATSFRDSVRWSQVNPLNPNKNRRVGFPVKVWEEVMAAGLAAYPIGRLVDAGTPASRVIFARPPQPTNRRLLVTYHNMLVDLCRVGARQFSTLLGAWAQQHDDAVVAGAVGSATDIYVAKLLLIGADRRQSQAAIAKHIAIACACGFLLHGEFAYHACNMLREPVLSGLANAYHVSKSYRTATRQRECN
jgi:hypothetical protein